eukprot:TRINITY_DN9281_c0_g1_i1.p2 TRINITY_DN9281_c0_g1~~TRINITY_DN9281_c0_g1_i1.p2  ORF type:complete len:110 (+),score=4.64 TRINITY_DN9281_c0_g1_i1:210-539(+)
MRGEGMSDENGGDETDRQRERDLDRLMKIFDVGNHPRAHATHGAAVLSSTSRGRVPYRTHARHLALCAEAFAPAFCLPFPHSPALPLIQSIKRKRCLLASLLEETRSLL